MIKNQILMNYNKSILLPFVEFDDMRPSNPLSIIRDKHEGKISVVKPLGGIAKYKGKASVVKPEATVKEEQGKGKCFHYQGEGHWKRIVLSSLSRSRQKERARREKLRLSLIY